MRTIRRIKDVKIRKHTIVFLTLSMVVAFIGWLLFLVFFGRVDPIIKSTTADFRLYHYGLITLPFWVYTFGAPFIYPIIVIYILNGNWILGIVSQIAGAAMSMILGAVLNISSAIVHVISHVDDNKVTYDICIVGVVGILASMLNLIVLQISIPLFNRLLSTKTVHVMGKHRVRPLQPRRRQQQEAFNEFSEEEAFLQEVAEEPYYDTVPEEYGPQSYSPDSRVYDKRKPPPRPPPPKGRGGYQYVPYDGASPY